jgi:hypothetical protein
MNLHSTEEPFLPAGENLVRARMSTGSMFPLVPIDSLLVFQRGGQYRPGDLVVFHRAGAWVCHRVVSVEYDRVVTWGDWSRHPDHPHAVEEIAGKCLLLVRKGVVVDLDWPVIRWGNRLAALLLPKVKLLLLRP